MRAVPLVCDAVSGPQDPYGPNTRVLSADGHFAVVQDEVNLDGQGGELVVRQVEDLEREEAHRARHGFLGSTKP